MSKTEPDPQLDYGMCIASCKMFEDAIDACEEVGMHRAYAALDRCVRMIRTHLGPTKRLRRVAEDLLASANAVYAKYMYTDGQDVIRISKDECSSKLYRQLKRDLRRAEQQQPTPVTIADV